MRNISAVLYEYSATFIMELAAVSRRRIRCRPGPRPALLSHSTLLMSLLLYLSALIHTVDACNDHGFTCMDDFNFATCYKNWFGWPAMKEKFSCPPGSICSEALPQPCTLVRNYYNQGSEISLCSSKGLACLGGQTVVKCQLDPVTKTYISSGPMFSCPLGSLCNSEGDLPCMQEAQVKREFMNPKLSFREQICGSYGIGCAVPNIVNYRPWFLAEQISRQCSSPGINQHKYNCQYFYTCSKTENRQGYIKRLWKCANNQLFSPKHGRCALAHEVDCSFEFKQTKEVQQDTSCSTFGILLKNLYQLASLPKSQLCEKCDMGVLICKHDFGDDCLEWFHSQMKNPYTTFTCYEQGVYRDPFNCQITYTCMPTTNSNKFDLIIRMCPGNTVYSLIYSVCVDNELGDCFLSVEDGKENFLIIHDKEKLIPQIHKSKIPKKNASLTALSTANKITKISYIDNFKMENFYSKLRMYIDSVVVKTKKSSVDETTILSERKNVECTCKNDNISPTPVQCPTHNPFSNTTKLNIQLETTKITVNSMIPKYGDNATYSESTTLQTRVTNEKDINNEGKTKARKCYVEVTCPIPTFTVTTSKSKLEPQKPTKISTLNPYETTVHSGDTTFENTTGSLKILTDSTTPEKTHSSAVVLPNQNISTEVMTSTTEAVLKSTIKSSTLSNTEGDSLTTSLKTSSSDSNVTPPRETSPKNVQETTVRTVISTLTSDHEGTKFLDSTTVKTQETKGTETIDTEIVTATRSTIDVTRFTPVDKDTSSKTPLVSITDNTHTIDIILKTTVFTNSPTEHSGNTTLENKTGSLKVVTDSIMTKLSHSSTTVLPNQNISKEVMTTDAVLESTVESSTKSNTEGNNLTRRLKTPSSNLSVTPPAKTSPRNEQDTTVPTVIFTLMSDGEGTKYPDSTKLKTKRTTETEPIDTEITTANRSSIEVTSSTFVDQDISRKTTFVSFNDTQISGIIINTTVFPNTSIVHSGNTTLENKMDSLKVVTAGITTKTPLSLTTVPPNQNISSEEITSATEAVLTSTRESSITSNTKGKILTTSLKTPSSDISVSPPEDISPNNEQETTVPTVISTLTSEGEGTKYTVSTTLEKEENAETETKSTEIITATRSTNEVKSSTSVDQDTSSETPLVSITDNTQMINITLNTTVFPNSSTLHFGNSFLEYTTGSLKVVTDSITTKLPSSPTNVLPNQNISTEEMTIPTEAVLTSSRESSTTSNTEGGNLSTSLNTSFSDSSVFSPEDISLKNEQETTVTTEIYTLTSDGEGNKYPDSTTFKTKESTGTKKIDTEITTLSRSRFVVTISTPVDQDTSSKTSIVSITDNTQTSDTTLNTTVFSNTPTVYSGNTALENTTSSLKVVSDSATTKLPHSHTTVLPEQNISTEETTSPTEAVLTSSRESSTTSNTEVENLIMRLKTPSSGSSVSPPEDISPKNVQETTVPTVIPTLTSDGEETKYPDSTTLKTQGATGTESLDTEINTATRKTIKVKNSTSVDQKTSSKTPLVNITDNTQTSDMTLITTVFPNTPTVYSGNTTLENTTGSLKVVSDSTTTNLPYLPTIVLLNQNISTEEMTSPTKAVLKSSRESSTTSNTEGENLITSLKTPSSVSNVFPPMKISPKNDQETTVRTIISTLISDGEGTKNPDSTTLKTKGNSETETKNTEITTATRSTNEVISSNSVDQDTSSKTSVVSITDNTQTMDITISTTKFPNTPTMHSGKSTLETTISYLKVVSDSATTMLPHSPTTVLLNQNISTDEMTSQTEAVLTSSRESSNTSNTEGGNLSTNLYNPSSDSSVFPPEDISPKNERETTETTVIYTLTSNGEGVKYPDSTTVKTQETKGTETIDTEINTATRKTTEVKNSTSVDQNTSSKTPLVNITDNTQTSDMTLITTVFPNTPTLHTGNTTLENTTGSLKVVSDSLTTKLPHSPTTVLPNQNVFTEETTSPKEAVLTSRRESSTTSNTEVENLITRLKTPSSDSNLSPPENISPKNEQKTKLPIVISTLTSDGEGTKYADSTTIKTQGTTGRESIDAEINTATRKTIEVSSSTSVHQNTSSKTPLVSITNNTETSDITLNTILFLNISTVHSGNTTDKNTAVSSEVVNVNIKPKLLYISTTELPNQNITTADTTGATEDVHTSTRGSTTILNAEGDNLTTSLKTPFSDSNLSPPGENSTGNEQETAYSTTETSITKPNLWNDFPALILKGVEANRPKFTVGYYILNAQVGTLQCNTESISQCIDDIYNNFRVVEVNQINMKIVKLFKDESDSTGIGRYYVFSESGDFPCSLKEVDCIKRLVYNGTVTNKGSIPKLFLPVVESSGGAFNNASFEIQSQLDNLTCYSELVIECLHMFVMITNERNLLKEPTEYHKIFFNNNKIVPFYAWLDQNSTNCKRENIMECVLDWTIQAQNIYVGNEATTIIHLEERERPDPNPVEILTPPIIINAIFKGTVAGLFIIHTKNVQITCNGVKLLACVEKLERSAFNIDEELRAVFKININMINDASIIYYYMSLDGKMPCDLHTIACIYELMNNSTWGSSDPNIITIFNATILGNDIGDVYNTKYGIGDDFDLQCNQTNIISCLSNYLHKKNLSEGVYYKKSNASKFTFMQNGYTTKNIMWLDEKISCFSLNILKCLLEWYRGAVKVTVENIYSQVITFDKLEQHSRSQEITTPATVTDTSTVQFTTISNNVQFKTNIFPLFMLKAVNDNDMNIIEGIHLFSSSNENLDCDKVSLKDCTKGMSIESHINNVLFQNLQQVHIFKDEQASPIATFSVIPPNAFFCNFATDDCISNIIYNTIEGSIKEIFTLEFQLLNSASYDFISGNFSIPIQKDKVINCNSTSTIACLLDISRSFEHETSDNANNVSGVKVIPTKVYYITTMDSDAVHEFEFLFMFEDDKFLCTMVNYFDCLQQYLSLGTKVRVLDIYTKIMNLTLNDPLPVFASSFNSQSFSTTESLKITSIPGDKYSSTVTISDLLIIDGNLPCFNFDAFDEFDANCTEPVFLFSNEYVVDFTVSTSKYDPLSAKFLVSDTQNSSFMSNDKLDFYKTFNESMHFHEIDDGNIPCYIDDSIFDFIGSNVSDLKELSTNKGLRLPPILSPQGYIITKQDIGCVKGGTFGDPTDCEIFRVCVSKYSEAQKEFGHFVLGCQADTKYSLSKRMCVNQTEELVDCAALYFDKIPDYLYKMNNIEKFGYPRYAKPNECSNIGIYQVKENCNQYYMCYYVKDNLVIYFQRCDVGMEFHRKKQICVPTTQDKCADAFYDPTTVEKLNPDSITYIKYSDI